MPFQKHYFILLAFIFSTFFLQAGQRSDEATASATDSISNSPRTDYLSLNQVSITDSVINYGKQFLNRPYRYGSSGADTFDCSGFTSYVYRNFGYDLEHSSAAQAQQFDTVKRNRLKTGDLVFFAGSRKSKRVGHVGIVTQAGEDGRFNFIHASCDKGVTISSSEEPYYSRRFIKANRVIGGSQLLAVAPSVSDNANADFQTDNNTPVTYPSKKIKKTIPAKYHRVKSGETLSEIADKYGLSVAELKRKNGLKGSKINLKQQLKVKDSETYTVLEPVKEVAAKKEDILKDQAAGKSKAEIASSIVLHKVKRGETLFSISKLYNTPVAELKKINNIPSGKIVPGQELKLSEVEAQSNVTEDKAENQQKVATHKVISGESLFNIAKMYGITVNDLKKMNEITENRIHAGQILKVSVPAEKAIAENIQPAPVTSAKPEVKTAPKSEPVIKPESKPEPKEIAKADVKTEVIARPGATVKIINHRVHQGENLITIARDFKVSLDELKRINNLESTKLSVGQEIFICLNTEAVVINPIPVSVPNQVAEPAVSQKTATLANSNVTPAESAQKPELTQKPISHKVKKGDNLNSIAEKYNISIDDLKETNGLSSNKINVGQKLKIARVVAEASPKESVEKPESPAKAVTHKVRKGENLASIAAKFNMTVDELKDLNGLTGSKINYGQQLVVSELTSERVKKASLKVEPKQKTIRHKVKSGESYYTIAHKYDCSVNDLKEWNRKSSTKIQPGDIIIVKAKK